MSQAPFPFTQAASQGYGDFAATIDDDEGEGNEHDQTTGEEEPIPDAPQSPEPEQEEEEEEEANDYGFTQTQERSYPAGIESPDPEDDLGPESPAAEDMAEEAPDEIEDEKPVASLHSRGRVQIMNDSDSEDANEQPQTSTQSSSNRHLKQFTMKNEESSKKHKKRRHEEHHSDKHSKRSRKPSSDDDRESKRREEQHVDATSDVEDVVDDIFGKEMDDHDEVAAELADLNNEEVVEPEEEEEEDVEQTGTYEDNADDEPSSSRKPQDYRQKSDALYEIDLYLEKKAEQRRGNRRRGNKDGDTDLSGADVDRIVKKLIDQMRVAAEEDQIFNRSQQPATAKLLLLPVVEQQLCRADLTEFFLDNGILTVFKDWLSPLPDRSLPNIKIREAVIRILQQFGVIHADPLKDSGIGKALMYLYKHPKETKENKIKLIRIIHDWARPIFSLDTDYKHLTREEREKRDVDQASLKRQTSLTSKQKNRSADVDLPFATDRRSHDDDDDNKDDDCPRARVPRPSNKDYVVRPTSKIEQPEKKSEDKRKTVSRLDEIKRLQQDRKRQTKPMSIVKLSVEGNRMHL